MDKQRAARQHVFVRGYRVARLSIVGSCEKLCALTGSGVRPKRVQRRSTEEERVKRVSVSAADSGERASTKRTERRLQRIAGSVKGTHWMVKDCSSPLF